MSKEIVMASIIRTISSRVDKTGKAEILLRLSIDHDHKQRIKSGIYISASRFRDGKIIKPRANRKEVEELDSIERTLEDLERFILSLCREHQADSLTKEYILESIENYRNPAMNKKDQPVSFFDTFNLYLDECGLSESRIKNLRVVVRALGRFELFKKLGSPEFKLELSEISDKTLEEFEQFLREEPSIYLEHPGIYKQIPAITRSQRKSPIPHPRGNNAISHIFKRLRAFYNWSIKKGFTTNYPFEKYTICGEVYGTPFYLTIEERNKIAEFDYKSRPALSVQRDIFIFQCLIGCRVSDLYSLTSRSVINNAIEYIPQKTKGERPEVVRVPLNDQAKGLIDKYANSRKTDDSPLFPFISSQRYNDAIKDIIKLAGIDRVVTVLNPTTGKEEKHPIYEVASSHMARRTFIGNLYKKVKDPNLVGSLSGHKEGSKAFARYRDIDEDIKKELVKLL